MIKLFSSYAIETDGLQLTAALPPPPQPSAATTCCRAPSAAGFPLQSQLTVALPPPSQPSAPSFLPQSQLTAAVGSSATLRL